MTVQELLEVLQGVVDKGQTVLLSRDEEGNDFRELVSYSPALYVAGKWGQADIYDPKPDSDDYKAPDHAKPCIVLWPS